MTKTLSVVLCFVLLATLANSISRADSLVAPQSDTSVEGPTNNSFPFNVAAYTSNGMRYQQVFAASEFAPLATPILISQISFRPDAEYGASGSVTIASIQIDLSTTASAPDSLNPTFATNVGADDVTVLPKGPLTLSSSFTGPVDGPKDFDVVINFITPFVYNPASGNLLLDVRNFSSEGNSPPSPVLLDADFNDTDGISRQWSFDVNSGVATPGTAMTYGLVTQFTFTPVPEPSTLALLCLGGIGLLARRWFA